MSVLTQAKLLSSKRKLKQPKFKKSVRQSRQKTKLHYFNKTYCHTRIIKTLHAALIVF